MPIPISQNLQLAGQSDVTPWELPYKELFVSLQNKQATQDKAKVDVAAQAELAAKLQSLPQDRLKAMGIVNNIYEQSTALSEGVDLTTPEGRRAVSSMKEGVRQQFAPGGEANAIESNLNTFNEWDKRQQEKLKSGKITQEMYEANKNFTLNNYGGVGEYNPATGQYISIKAEETADYVDAAQRVKDLVKDVKANATKTTTDLITGDEMWVIKTMSGEESVTEERIMEIAIQKLLTDDKTNNYLTQAQKIGIIPEGSFYHPITEQPIPYMLQYPVTKKGELISIEQFNEMTEQEKAGIYVIEELNSNHYLSSVIQATAQELGFKKTEFSKTRSANDYFKISYKHKLDNAIVDMQFDSQGYQLTMQGGDTPEKLNDFITTTQNASQSVIDEFLCKNSNTICLVGQITPEQWLSGNLPDEVKTSFTPDARRSITADLNRKALVLDKEQQRLNEAEVKAGKNNLKQSSLDLFNMVDAIEDNAKLLEANMSGKSDKEIVKSAIGYNHNSQLVLEKGEIGYYIKPNGALYRVYKAPNNSRYETFVGKVPKDIATKNTNEIGNLKEYQARLKKEVKNSSTGSASVNLSALVPGVDATDITKQIALKKQLNQFIGNPAYYSSFNVRLSDADITNLEKFTGVNLTKHKQNGEIPARVLSTLGVNLEAIGDEKNIHFTEQPIGDKRYASKPLSFTKGSGADKQTIEISTLFPIGDGNNGTVGNKELGSFFNSPEAQAQELILYVKTNNGLEKYSPKHIPGVTIIKEDNGSINVKMPGVNKNYSETEGVKLISDFLRQKEMESNIIGEKGTKGAVYIESIKKYSLDHNVSFEEAKLKLDQAQKN